MVDSRLLLFAKGLAMGAADVVPGVSGGTIAFISGIYEELVDSLRGLTLDKLRIWHQQGWSAFWKSINGSFLALLLAGILTSIFSLARVVTFCLEHYPIQLWSFFFGLILASIFYVGRQQSRWHFPEWIALGLGSVAAFAVVMSPPLQVGTGMLPIFFSGMLAICAMILPGISGSFILVLLGMYHVILEAVTEFNGSLLAVFALGCLIGLISFSRLLSWLLHRYHSLTLAVLMGFLLGSLPQIWPWKQPLEIMFNASGREIVLAFENLTPSEYYQVTGNEAATLPAIALMVVGVVFVLGLENLAFQDKPD